MTLSGDVEQEARVALTNMGHILEAAGCTYKHGIVTRVCVCVSRSNYAFLSNYRTFQITAHVVQTLNKYSSRYVTPLTNETHPITVRP